MPHPVLGLVSDTVSDGIIMPVVSRPRSSLRTQISRPSPKSRLRNHGLGVAAYISV